jgi:hypothetical protein
VVDTVRNTSHCLLLMLISVTVVFSPIPPLHSEVSAKIARWPKSGRNVLLFEKSPLALLNNYFDV